MATEEIIIAAIELGSSKVTGLAGRKQPDGAIRIMGFAQEPSTSFIRKGRINNINKMTQCIVNIRERLEKQMQGTITRVYVGIGGMGMHTVSNPVRRNMEAKVEVTQEMIDAMCDENRASASADYDILESVPQEYKLGTQLQTEPVGILADRIEGRYLNIVANSTVREEIRNCFRNAGVVIADLPITVLAMADIMLTAPEKRSGCVFVDMGSETTSVAIYKNNILRHLAVIPLGSANINRDIMSLQIEDDEAEELKLRYGSAVLDLEAPERKPIALRDGRQVDYNEFAELVEARMEEIILNVKNQIALSPYDKSQLIGGLVITGGGANMKDVDKAFVKDTGFEKIRFVRNIHIPVESKDYPDFNANGDCNAAIALVEKGEKNCCGGVTGELTGTGGNNAGTDPADSLTEEEKQRLAAEEAARQEAAEKERLAEEARREAEEEARRKAAERKKNIKAFGKKISNFFSGLVSEKDN